MKRLVAAAAIVFLSSGLGMAQTPPGPVAPAPSPAADSTVPNLAPPSATTVGQAPGVNPANPQDQIGRANAQDRNSPNASNPQDMRPLSK